MSKEIYLDEVKKFWPQSAPNINNIKKYVEKYQNEKIVIKCGGNVLIDKDIFNHFIEDINILHKLGLSIIVVHGGGPRIKRELDKSNIQSKFIRGLRVTDERVINIVETVLINFNNDIVASLKKNGSKAISINTKNNNIIEVIPEVKELGFVGTPNKINNDIIINILNQKKIPIISPLGLGKNNQSYNINGDTAAGAIAKSLKSRRLLLMTNVEGVLNKEKKLIEEISSSEIVKLIEDKTITEGMIPKINTCLDAVNNGVTAVGIIDGRKQHSLLFEIFSDKGSGTLIRK
jgi:acetylglutamate kinase